MKPEMWARNLFLSGFMGAGKTSVGPLVAQALGWPFIDSDAEIERREKRTIAEIFEGSGEATFRESESRVLHELALAEGQIVALGGGALLHEANRRLLKAEGVVVHLSATVDTLLSRLSQEHRKRPLLAAHAGGEDALRARIQALLSEREQAYGCADIRVVTDGRSLGEVAAEITRWFKGEAR